MIEYFCEHCGSSYRIDYRGTIPIEVSMLCPECLGESIASLTAKLEEEMERAWNKESGLWKLVDENKAKLTLAVEGLEKADNCLVCACISDLAEVVENTRAIISDTLTKIGVGHEF